MVSLPDGENILKITLFVSTECTNVTDEQTDTQTQHDDIGRACIASRGKMFFRGFECEDVCSNPQKALRTLREYASVGVSHV